MRLVVFVVLLQLQCGLRDCRDPCAVVAVEMVLVCGVLVLIMMAFMVASDNPSGGGRW